MIGRGRAGRVAKALGQGLGVVVLTASLSGCGLFGGSDSNQPLTTKTQTASGSTVQPIASGLSGDQQNASYSDQQLTAQSEQASAPPPVQVATIAAPTTTDNGSAASTAATEDATNAATDTTSGNADSSTAATDTGAAAATTASAAAAQPVETTPAATPAAPPPATAAQTQAQTQVQAATPAATAEPLPPPPQTATAVAPPPAATSEQPVQVASVPAAETSPVTVDESQIDNLQAAPPPAYQAPSAPAYSSAAPAYGATYAAAPGSLPPPGWPIAVVFFADGSTALSDRAMGVLRDVVLLQKQRGGAIRIVGHASARTAAVVYGEHDDINQKLSDSRARAVARALIRFGAASGSISTSGVGAQQPVYYEFMPTGEAGNRRVEVFLDGASTAGIAPPQLSPVAQLTPVAPPAPRVASSTGSVTVDLSVLDQLDQPATAQPVSTQLAYAATSAYPNQGSGGLLYPPLGNPVSMLTVPPPPMLSPVVAERPATSTGMSLASAAEALQAEAAAEPAVTVKAKTKTSTVAAVPPASTGGSASGASQASASDAAAGADTSAGGIVVMPAPPPTPPVPGTQAADATGSGSATAASTQAQTAASTTADSGTIVPAPGSGGTAAPTAGAAAETTIASIGTQPTDSGGVTTSSDGGLHIVFPQDSAEIPDAAKSELDALAQKMTADGSLRIELMAYASGTADAINVARRMSLLRALAVRSYLVKHGVSGMRMDVRALGNKVQGSPADRVDILPSSS